jgi:hypothetical protein
MRFFAFKNRLKVENYLISKNTAKKVQGGALRWNNCFGLVNIFFDRYF